MNDFIFKAKRFILYFIILYILYFIYIYIYIYINTLFSVHLIKNIWNNLLNAKGFVFPEFNFEEFEDIIHVNSGEIRWHLLHHVHRKDIKLPANLRKAYKLSPKCLHPGNNKQSVPLALHIFHETTSAPIKNYFPEEIPAAEFLNLVNTWWTISNSKNIFNTSNRIGNAAIFNDKKPVFFTSIGTIHLTMAKFKFSWL